MKPSTLETLKNRRILSWILFPLTMWYGIGVGLRNLLWDIGLRRPMAPHVTTIAIGNLAAGGTGKTPMAEYLLRKFANGMHVAMLSRGYRRSTKGFILASDGTIDAVTLGDEPSMIAKKFPNVTTAVCENRLLGINNLLALDPPPQLIILDDAFQQRGLKPTVSILLTEYGHPWFDDHIMPYGTLREHKSARSRAGIIIVTKSPRDIPPLDRRNYIARLGLKPHQKVFFAHIQYLTPYNLATSEPVTLTSSTSVLAVTGIANPHPLIKHLQDTVGRVEHLSYPDHHDFNTADLRHIAERFDAMEGHDKIIITTAKDVERLLMAADAEMLQRLPVCVQPISMEFNNSTGDSFDTVISTIVRENISFLRRLDNSPYMREEE